MEIKKSELHTALVNSVNTSDKIDRLIKWLERQPRYKGDILKVEFKKTK